MDSGKKWLVAFAIMWAVLAITWLVVAIIKNMWGDWKFWLWEVVSCSNLIAHIVRIKRYK